MQQTDKICISGVGVISSLGQRVSENWDRLRNKQTASSSEVLGFKASDYIKRRYLRPLDAATIHCIAMTAAALQDAGVNTETIEAARIGIVIGSMYAGIGCIFDFKKTCYEGRQDNYLGLSPLYFPGIVFNSLSGQPAIEFGYTGPNVVVNTGMASGLLAVIKGIEYIQSGKADVIIAGGAEMSYPFIRQKYKLQKNDPAIAMLGPDFQPAEAACLFVLHRENDPRFHNAKKYATVEGWRYGFMPEGCSTNSLVQVIQSIPEPQRDLLETVVMDSYKNSPLFEYESQAIGEMFASRNLTTLCNKENFGHTLGASGSLNLFHGLFFSREQRTTPGSILVNSLDPCGNYAFLTLRPEQIT